MVIPELEVVPTIPNCGHHTLGEIKAYVVNDEEIPGFKHQLWWKESIFSPPRLINPSLEKKTPLELGVKDHATFRLEICPIVIVFKPRTWRENEYVTAKVEVTHRDTVEMMREKLREQVFGNRPASHKLQMYSPNRLPFEPGDMRLDNWKLKDGVLEYEFVWTL